MHVLPLPFGLALALVPRREADKLRREEPVERPVEKMVHERERILGDIRYFNSGRYIL